MRKISSTSLSLPTQRSGSRGSLKPGLTTSSAMTAIPGAFA